MMAGAFLIGIGSGILFEIFRLWRYFKNGFVSVFLQDFLFFLLTFFAVTWYCIQKNDGQIRWFYLPPVGIGFVLYRLSFGKWLYRPIVWITEKIGVVLCKIFRLFWMPISWMIGKTAYLLRAFVLLNVIFLKKLFIFLKKCNIIKFNKTRFVSEGKNESGKSQKEENIIRFYH